MRRQNIVRAFLFCVFFAVGAVVLSGSVLSDVLLSYYRGRHLLQAQRQHTEHLKSLITDYNVILTEFEKDPNFVKRIAPATLGAEPDDANTIYPKATAEQLAAVRRILAQRADRKSTKPAVPGWLSRCSGPRRRIVLFFAGAVLILVSFVCFGPAPRKEVV